MSTDTTLRTDTVTTRINRYEVELDFFIENGEQRCFGTVTFERNGISYSGSITLLEAYGYLDCDDSRDGNWEVPAKTIERIVDWAYENDY